MHSQVSEMKCVWGTTNNIRIFFYLNEIHPYPNIMDLLLVILESPWLGGSNGFTCFILNYGDYIVPMIFEIMVIMQIRRCGVHTCVNVD